MPPSTYDPRTGTISAQENKWFVPEERLNPDQQRFLTTVNVDQRNIWIKGFAGSGKSILLVHVAKKILASKPNAKIVLVVYTQSLVEMFKTALRELHMNIPVITYFAFMDSSARYDYILCDEVQDLTPRILNKMYERASHVIVSGDSNQSIYPEDPRWREATVRVDEILTLIRGDDFNLTIIERMTKNIVDAVKSFLPRLNIFGRGISLSSPNETPIVLCRASSVGSEIDYIIKQATRIISRGYTSAILIPTQKKIVEFVNQALSAAEKPQWEQKTNSYGKVDFGSMNQHLSNNGIKMQYVGNGYGSFKDSTDYVVLMTYHSAKGLDFDYVYIPYCNNYLWISYNEELAKTLFMVAMTRARMNLYITYTGTLHSYVNPFMSNCQTRSI